MKKILPIAVLAAVVGGGAGAGTVTLLDDDGGTTTTVVRQAPLAQSSAGGTDVRAEGEGLTARDIYKRDAPGVVFIRADVVQESSSPFDFGQPSQRGTSTGSGFVIDADGNILTNAHVVEGAQDVSVQFADKKSARARVVGRDVSTDLAVLKVDPEGLDLKPLALGSSKGVQVGDPVVAIGNPFGLDRTLTTGVISALQRQITAPNGFSITNVIQTDAPINPGNSGGPLIDAAGRVIGINSQIQTGSGSGGNVGIGFAVPVDTAKQIVPQLKSGGKVERGYIGVSTATVDKSLSDLNLPVDRGALVQTVDAGSPADKAGLRAGQVQATIDGQPVVIGGDIITEVDGRPIRSNDELRDRIAGKKPGDEVELTYRRGKDERTAKVKLAERPATADQSAQPQDPSLP